MELGYAWSDKYRLYSPASLTQDAFTLTAGRTSVAALAALTPALGVFWLGTAQNPGLVMKWAHVIPFGDGADGATFDYRLWLVFAEHVENTAHDSLQLVLAGSGTCTLGTNLGAAGSLVGAAQRYVHAMTWATGSGGTTPKGEGENRWSGFGAVEPQVYSPADNTRAGLTIGHTARADGLILEVDLDTATGANFLVAQGT